jgi:hypothetical protein
MRGVMGAADRAVAHARSHLLAASPGSRLHDVSEDPRFQHRGVDLLWEREGLPIVGVEVKGDRQPRRRNYFFELVSNLEKDTPGCFLYSTADLLVYVFLAQAELHILPLPAARAWFLTCAKDFPVKAAQTRMGSVTYTTLGAIVPARRVQENVPGAQRIKLVDQGDNPSNGQSQKGGKAPVAR